jgi:hypothetical protein
MDRDARLCCSGAREPESHQLAYFGRMPLSGVANGWPGRRTTALTVIRPRSGFCEKKEPIRAASRVRSFANSQMRHIQRRPHTESGSGRQSRRRPVALRQERHLRERELSTSQRRDRPETSCNRSTRSDCGRRIPETPARQKRHRGTYPNPQYAACRLRRLPCAFSGSGSLFERCQTRESQISQRLTGWPSRLLASQSLTGRSVADLSAVCRRRRVKVEHHEWLGLWHRRAFVDRA